MKSQQNWYQELSSIDNNRHKNRNRTEQMQKIEFKFMQISKFHMIFPVPSEPKVIKCLQSYLFAWKTINGIYIAYQKPTELIESPDIILDIKLKYGQSELTVVCIEHEISIESVADMKIRRRNTTSHPHPNPNLREYWEWPAGAYLRLMENCDEIV